MRRGKGSTLLKRVNKNAKHNKASFHARRKKEEGSGPRGYTQDQITAVVNTNNPLK